MSKQSSAHLFTFVLIAVTLGFTPTTRADDTETLSRFGGVATLGAGIAGLKDENPTHLMTSEFLEIFGGYRTDEWIFGPMLNLRWVQQQSSLQDVGGTNFAGTAWNLGIGASYKILPSLSAQAVAIFLGNYRFAHQTYASEDAHLSSPLGFQLKPQYFFLDGKPYSLDLDLKFIRWSKFVTSSGEVPKHVNEMSAGIAFSYHFPNPTLSIVESNVNQPTHTPLEDLQNTLDLKKTDRGMMMSLSGALFATRSSEISNPEAQQKLEQAGATLSKVPNLQVLVEGYTDSVGTDEHNLTLSQSRADHVKELLVKNGVQAEAVTARGLGASNPISENDTREGRAKNRRIEIYIDKKQGESQK